MPSGSGPDSTAWRHPQHPVDLDRYERPHRRRLRLPRPRLASARQDAGHQVSVLSRRTPPGGEAAGSPGIVQLVVQTVLLGRLADACVGVDAVINLAGESIAAGRWTAARKRALVVDSRVLATQHRSPGPSRRATTPPSVFRAVRWWAQRVTGATRRSRTSRARSDFLAGLAARWEREALAAAPTEPVSCCCGRASCRPVGGANARTRRRSGSACVGRSIGREYTSWIHRDDWVLDGRLVPTAGVPGRSTSWAPIRDERSSSRARWGVLWRPSLAHRAAGRAEDALVGEVLRGRCLRTASAPCPWPRRTRRFHVHPPAPELARRESRGETRGSRLPSRTPAPAGAPPSLRRHAANPALPESSVSTAWGPTPASSLDGRGCRSNQRATVLAAVAQAAPLAQRAVPAAAERAGFTFTHPHLEPALRHSPP